MINVPRPFRTAGIHAIWLLASISAFGQGSPSAAPPAKAVTLEDSVQALAAEVKELNATIQELRAEVLHSRQETRDLRADLDRTVETLSSKGPAVSAEIKGTVGIPEARPATQETTPSAGAPTVESAAEARLNRLEEDQELLQAKVHEQHQTKVESASKYRVKLSGIALFNLFGNKGSVDNQDVPNLALPRTSGETGGSIGATLRQSEVGLEVYGPNLAGAQASANINLDFMGGFSDVSNGVTSNLVRLRTATLRLDWTRTSVITGQDIPFFSPLSPTSFASLGYPAFADAGNLWTWIPQVRVEHRMQFSEAEGLLVQGGILDPLSGEPPYAQFYRTPQAGEESRIPALGSRAAWTHGEGDRALTVGIGGYYSRQDYGAGRSTDAWAATADWNAPLRRRFALSGEFYRGRALGGLGAAQGRSVLFDGPESNPVVSLVGLATVGGWTQLKFKATEAIEFNAAYGQDNPFAHDHHYLSFPTAGGYSSVAKNQNAMFNVIYRPRSDLLFALEYKYLDTLQTSNVVNTAGILNLSMGVLF